MPRGAARPALLPMACQGHTGGMTHHQGLLPMACTLPLASLISFSTGAGSSPIQGLSPKSACMMHRVTASAQVWHALTTEGHTLSACLAQEHRYQCHYKGRQPERAIIGAVSRVKVLPALRGGSPSEDQGAGSLSQRTNR